MQPGICVFIRWITACLLLTTQVQAADLTVLSAGAFKSVAADLIPGFEATTGNRVTLRNDTVGALVRRIKANESFDVVIMSPSGLDELTQAGKLASGSHTQVAKVGIGMAVRARSSEGDPTSDVKRPLKQQELEPDSFSLKRSGSMTDAPHPDISTVAAFKTTMLQARAVAYIDPASGGSSGIYLSKLFQTLGIADAMAAKSVLIKGGLAAEAVTDGRADIALQQISEIIAEPGVTLVGPLPAEIQNETTYAGAIATASTAPGAARAFLTFLSGPNAQPALTRKGMVPP
jgi:molybdate transport system substrate-binding protein